MRRDEQGQYGIPGALLISISIPDVIDERCPV
jgi:hypothetical protein